MSLLTAQSLPCLTKIRYELPGAQVTGKNLPASPVIISSYPLLAEVTFLAILKMRSRHHDQKCLASGESSRPETENEEIQP